MSEVLGTAAELDAITADLDATTTAWAAAGHRLAGAEYEAREEVFRRLRAWNEAREAGRFLGVRPPR